MLNFNDLYTSNYARVKSTAMQYLKNAEDAEDVAQDVFVKAYNSLGNFRGDSELSTWLTRIAINESKNFLDKKKRRPYTQSITDDNGADVYPEELEDTVHPETQAEYEEAEQKVVEALSNMPSHYKEVFVLREQDNLSMAEIADKLSMKEGTVKSRLSRARNWLKKNI